MAINNDFRRKTNLIGTKYHFVTDLVKTKIVELKYFASEGIVAEMMAIKAAKLQNIEMNVS